MTIQILVLANRKVELQLRVLLGRSETLDVIFRYGLFPLEPPILSLRPVAIGSRIPNFSLSQSANAHPLYCKYETLLQSECAYFDTDIVVLRDRESGSRRRPRILLPSPIPNGPKTGGHFRQTLALSHGPFFSVASLDVQLWFLCIRATAL